MPGDYKASKEAFVSDQSGSTVTHINLISFVALSSIALHSALRPRLPQSNGWTLVTDFILLVFPLLLSMTIFADMPLILNGILLFPTFFLLRYPIRPQEPRSSSSSSPVSPPLANIYYKNSEDNEAMHSGIGTHLPALTTYRTHMLVMTFLGILAVDFPIFPRSLAKCETFGVSLMDMGVGSFVFSQGVVSAIPLLKDPRHLSAPLLPKLTSATRKMLPLVFLGLLRVILVKGTEYPEHESEYGTHWNFFITMAALPPLQVLLHPILLNIPIVAVGAGITLLHQYALSNTFLQDWALNALRLNIISKNKEGLVSLPGYLAIHLLGLLTGTVLLPPSPFYFHRVQNSIRHNGNGVTSVVDPSEPRSRQDDETVKQLSAHALLWWSSRNLLTHVGLGGGGVSRQLANAPYVLWVATYNTTFITAYLALDLYFFPPPPQRESSGTPSNFSSPSSNGSASPLETLIPGARPPRKAATLLEAINVNGLPLFLLANVATGLVNLTIQTMYTSDAEAIAILSLYAFGLSAVAWFTRDRRLWKM